MIVLVVSIETTAETIASLRQAVAEMETASRKEAGCHDYTFAVELNDPDKLRITECWEDEAALRSHFDTSHMAAFNQAIATMAPRNTSIACYQASEIPFPIARG